MNTKVLLIEDCLTLARIWKEFFKKNDLRILTATTGKEGLKIFRNESPQLVLLDVILPDTTGYELIHSFQEIDRTIPVIMVSGKKKESLDQIKGLELGAIHYLQKPFELRILLAQIKTILNFPKSHTNEFNFGNYKIMIEKQILKINDKLEELREKDAIVLNLLLENEGHIISRKNLLDFLWGDDSYAKNNLLDGIISRLRRILNPYCIFEIKNIYASGYVLKINNERIIH